MRIILSILLFACACLLAGLYGMLHNQISYSVSNEYFTAYKFHQFQISPDIPQRLGASIVGWYASWWMGLVIGAVLIPYAYAIPKCRDFAVTTLRAFASVTVTALISGLAGLMLAWLLVTPERAGEIERYDNSVVNDVAFARARSMHNASYLGGLVGIVVGLGLVRRRRIRHYTGGVVHNFGRNLNFQPAQILLPRTEDELLAILAEHHDKTIRVVGSRHAWSAGIETNDVLIDMSHFRSVTIHSSAGETRATVGGGCQIKRLLKELAEQDLTTPSVGLITEQTIAGATATGTHGSGKNSLSHYIVSARIACFDESGVTPRVINVNDGDELRAARCSLGCLGVVVEVTIPCVPQYYVQEKTTPAATVTEAIKLEESTPLQQFFLMPHSWKFFVQQRRVADVNKRKGFAALYRWYFFIVIDITLHLMIKLNAVLLRTRFGVHALYRHIVPRCLFTRWVVVDRSDRQLVMEHEMFRHLELEVFVPRSQIADSTNFVIDTLKYADDAHAEISEGFAELVRQADMEDEAKVLHGTYTHHYAICFRRVLADDTLISMTAGADEDWYAISFITYREPRHDFYRTAEFLARSMHKLYGARIHWGKWFPLDNEQVREQYPDLDRFREIAEQFDPNGVFRNDMIREKLGWKA